MKEPTTNLDIPQTRVIKEGIILPIYKDKLELIEVDRC